MKTILFLDLETTNSGDIKEIGLVYGEKELKTTSLTDVKLFIEEHNPTFIGGHNFVTFDQKMLKETSLMPILETKVIIDTLPISLLLFNERTFHHLPKSYKNEDNFLNDPVEDSKLSRKLFEQCVENFLGLEKRRQNVFFSLLGDQDLFQGFFQSIENSLSLECLAPLLLEKEIAKLYESVIKNSAKIPDAIGNHPVELAYILALLTPDIEIKAHPPKILYDYPAIVPLQKELCFDLQKSMDELLDFSKETFGFGEFNEFPRLNATLESGAMISQREIVEAALRDESFLAVLPTGGGKTFTFWLPALIKAKAYKSLTVVVSPLQALMRNHIESFNKQVANFTAVALSGYLSALERADVIDKVVNGEADILYIAPESLRSNAIFSVLKNRLIERFVIDEAHCLSTWGHDFRHDYFYIGEFINDLLKAKSYQETIPVSCFTATAKPNVIDDISNYIHKTLGFTLTHHLALPERKNLDYKALSIDKKADKYVRLLELLNTNKGAALVYIPSSTKMCDEVAQKLSLDLAPRSVRAFHSKLDSDVKMEILTQYVNNEVDIVVATTAFGMGVDKPNIENVIHYEVSDSLENYAQEAGRGARDKKLRAFCPLLFDENDLDKHFASLNTSKVSAAEVNAVFRVLKNQKSDLVTMTTREIAKAANWDVEDSNQAYDLKIKTALLELEREGYIERGRNQVRFYADAVAQGSFEMLRDSCNAQNLSEEETSRLTLVLSSILGRGKPKAVQIDEISQTLGFEKEIIATSILKLKEMEIVSDSKDLSLYITKSAEKEYEVIRKIESFLLEYFARHTEGVVSIRSLNEALIQNGCINAEANKTELIKELLKLWREARESFRFRRVDRQRDSWYTELSDYNALKKSMELKHEIATKVIAYFVSQIDDAKKNEKCYIEFSLLQLHKELNLPKHVHVKMVDKVLLHLHLLHVLELAEGRFIYYAPMNIHKSDKFDKKLKYTKTEYAIRMKPHYEQKVESIHIMGEYAQRLQNDPKQAMAFLKDYFTDAYESFKRKYKLAKLTLSQPMTKKRYEKIFMGLSEEQQQIIEDKESRAMMILAGPGSGKTKVLVHKIASLILKEDIKADQFLMLTYSRTAVAEFKSRLLELLGSLAHEIDIYTFHGYALQLIGRQVQDNDNDLMKHVVATAAHQLSKGQIAAPFKSVIVLDEFQDINADAFKMVEAMVSAQDGEMRLVAVGDDDQCILSGVNNADVAFFKRYAETFGGDEGGYAQYALTRNFRSDGTIVDLANHIVKRLTTRFKTELQTAESKHAGEVTVNLCRSSELVTPVVNVLKTLDENQSVAVLAYSNEEVESIYSLLRQNGIKAEYLLERGAFKLRNLSEIYFVDYKIKELCNGSFQIEEEHIAMALQMALSHFKGSRHLDLLKQVVNGFVKEHEVFYASIWESYLDEIKFEDFESGARVVVSTMHKAKGKEFDTVVMLVRRNHINDDLLRLYYVGMTRAKSRLVFVTDDHNFVRMLPNNIYIHHDEKEYDAPSTKTFIMSLRDIYLGFSGRQNYVPEELIAGTKATIGMYPGSNRLHLFVDDEAIGCLAKSFDEMIKEKLQSGYSIDDIEIESVVIWKDKERKEAIKQPLCKLVLKNNNQIVDHSNTNFEINKVNIL